MLNSFFSHVQYNFFLIVDIIKVIVLIIYNSSYECFSTAFLLGLAALSVVPTMWIMLQYNESFFAPLIFVLSIYKMISLIGEAIGASYLVLTMKCGIAKNTDFQQLGFILIFLIIDSIILFCIFQRRKQLCKLFQ